MSSLNGMSIVALVVALGAMGVALWRAQRSPHMLVSREQGLEKRVAELEGTVASLQRLLFEKEQQNGQLTKEVAVLTARVQELERAAPKGPTVPERPETLLVVTGSDPMLRIDLSVLREVEQHGWLVSRVYPPTMEKLKTVIDRARANRRTVRYLHMAVHSGPDGVQLGDGLATGDWLSENLKGVEVLLLNGCSNDDLGDWIGSVKSVVTMREDVRNDDAALFARLFWVAIAGGASPEDAYYSARDRSPQGVSEFVELV